VNDDSENVRTLSAGERFPGEDDGATSSGLRHGDDNVELTGRTSTDARTALSGIGNIDNSRCRSSLGRPWKDLHSGRRRRQRDVHSHQASLGHVTPPPSWSDRSMTSPEATRRRADFRFHDVVPPSLTQHPPTMPTTEVMQCLEQREKQSHVGMTTCSSACDDVQISDSTTNDGRSVDTVTEKNSAAAACTVNMTSKSSCADIISRLRNKNVKRRHTLELDLSAHLLVDSLMPKPLPVMRKSTSCCELSVVAAVPQADSENRKSTNSIVPACETSTSIQRPLLQLHLGQKFGVVCQKTECGTTFAVVNVTSVARRSASTDVEKRAELRDVNDNADDEQTDKQTKLPHRPEPSCENENRTVADKDSFDVRVDCITDDVIQRSSSSSSRHERQLIFV